MEAQQRAELKRDISEHGLLEPITTFEGQTLDGLHREQLCDELGIEPRYVEFTGTLEEAADFVVSKNLHRRHLTEAQLAALGAELVPFFEAEAKERRVRKSVTARAAKSPGAPKGTAAEQAAKVVGSRPRSVETARRVQKENPEVFEDMKAGKTSIRGAEARVTGKTRNGKRKTTPNWDGKTNAARERELRGRDKGEGKPDRYIELLRFQQNLVKMTRLFESWHLYEYAFDLESAWLVADIVDDLISHGEWYDRTLSAAQGWLLDGDVREKIAKLRNTTGRSKPEAETALRLADRLERKLEARLKEGK